METIHVGDVVGEYIVTDVAGFGGMGTVYKIEHVITKRIEAMKLLPSGSSSDPEQVRRFEREIQVQARLHHPNIVALYNAVRDGDSIALIMEFVEGESLQRRIEAGPLPVETALYFAAQVLHALAYAHEAGVIHRDVSPANIIITPKLDVKLSDFGLAVGATDVRLSSSGVPLGSPCYMSPEQVKGVRELDGRTDIYAMGAVLHEMLSGRKLFEEQAAFGWMRAHVEDQPRPPSMLNPRVPKALDEVVMRALAKDPAMRFQTADEFRLALQPLASEPRTAPSTARKSRQAMLVALALFVSAAGVCAVRVFQLAASARAAAISKRNAVRLLPAAAVSVEPQAPAVVAATPTEAQAAPELPVAIEEAPGTVSRRAPSHSKPPRRDSGTPPSTAIRVSGESQTVEPVPAPKITPPLPVVSAELAAPKTNSTEAPETEPPPLAAKTSESQTTSLAPAPSNPRNAGNRLVRALNKVNPFRKKTTQSAPKATQKQD
jgi:serine/threonine-protein kinase